MSLPDVEDLAVPAVKQPSGPLAEVAQLCETDRKLPPYAQRGKLHNLACERKLEGYTDPITAEAVPSAFFLRQRDCCGAKCRHCPFNFKNVPKPKRASSAISTDSSSSASPATTPAQQRPATPPTFLDAPVASGSVQYEFPPPQPVRTEPLTVDKVFTQTELSKIPSYAIKGRLHRKAVELQYDSYVMPSDPKTAIFSSVYLTRLGACCGFRCHHCPFSYSACPKHCDSESSSDSSSSPSSPLGE